MKILFLTQYYPPETGAPQNKLHELALRLKRENLDVEVLTAMPNYPKMEVFEEYKHSFFKKEVVDGIMVYRSWIFVKKSKSIFFRLLNYFSFVFTSLIIGIRKTGKYDYILVESPPLFLGISAYLLCKWKGAKLIFNVSDLWPESAEKLGLVTNKMLLKTATVLEEFLYKKSVLITAQTQGIVQNIKNRFPAKNVYWLPNGVDLDYYNPDNVNSLWRSENDFENDDILFLYAGIIGHAQGLEIIINAAKKLVDCYRVKFVIVGDGPVKAELLELAENAALKNVFFFDAVSKEKMPIIVKACDMALVPLKKLPLFEGAIPSKIFENLAMKKPILLGVEGEAKVLFIDEGNCGLAFEPENDKALAEIISEIYNGKHKLSELGNNGRNYVSKKFNRNTIAHQFHQTLQELNDEELKK